MQACLLVLLTLYASEPAPAVVAEARARFQEGSALYAAGQYRDAVAAFEAGYALHPRPSFLLNVGQSYRRMGDLPRAKEAYLRFMRKVPENDPLRSQALTVLAEIEVEMQAAPAAAPEPPPAASAPVPAPLPLSTTPSSADERRGPDGWATGALVTGGVALAAGIGLELLAKRESDALDKLNRERGTYDAASDRRGRRYETLGLVSLGVGAALAVTGVVLWRTGGDEPSAVALRPWVSRSALAATIGTSF